MSVDFDVGSELDFSEGTQSSGPSHQRLFLEPEPHRFELFS